MPSVLLQMCRSTAFEHSLSITFSVGWFRAWRATKMSVQAVMNDASVRDVIGQTVIALRS